MKQLGFRERVKFACLMRCIEAGLSEEEMTGLLQRKTAELRRAKQAAAPAAGAAAAGASASVIAKLKNLLPSSTTAVSLGFGLPLLGLGGVSLLAAAIGNTAGKTVKSLETGALPDAKDITLFDEAVAYEKAAEEIQRRMAMAEQERKSREKGSARRLF
jgi:hypothetical protein